MSRITRSENYSHNDINNIVRILCERYDFLERLSLGKSVVGRDIPAVRLANGQSYTLFAAAFHGSEHITSNICLHKKGARGQGSNICAVR